MNYSNDSDSKVLATMEVNSQHLEYKCERFESKTFADDLSTADKVDFSCGNHKFLVHETNDCLFLDNDRLVESDNNVKLDVCYEANMKCNFCQYSGHLESTCWRKLKRCVICGGDHQMSLCKNYDNNYSIHRKQLCCSLCTGSHLGRNCPLHSRPHKRMCNWCGKTNHVEAGCWVKQGYCLLCGDSSHLMKNCRRFRDINLNCKPRRVRYAETHEDCISA